MSAKAKLERRTRRRHRIRRKVKGTAERPRLSIFRSSNHIYVQAIDDITGKTLAQASSLKEDGLTDLVGDSKSKIAVGKAVGKLIARRLKEMNVATAVFDRNGYIYHGRVQAIADGAREEGLQV
ncbi:MAG: 50S ribosomal protein L18 [bacterium]|nr:50S ribosomal protein L18 [Candidatus Kapabacteria bacterium]